MLNKLVQNYILNSIISSLKGKKRWLVIVVLVAAQIAQSAGINVEEFISSVLALLENSEV